MYITLDSVRRVNSATTTTKGRRSYTRRRVPQREEEKDYQKILVIGEEMGELQANTAGISGVVGFSVLGYNYSLTVSFRSPPQQKRENRLQAGEFGEEKRKKIIKKCW
jgi:hypothetical protein